MTEILKLVYKIVTKHKILICNLYNKQAIIVVQCITKAYSRRKK